ncbi:MAG: HlyD family efflux transporter periplasmic adaptor subunit [Planctomycetia bacterium]|nr:HlyD family efflux transporter periplasmic adaptor subunit [Planctomycetia bacterium]
MRFVLTAIGVGLAVLATSGAVSAETITQPSCRVTLIDEAQVSAQEAGMLLEVAAQDGQQVEAGEVLARIDETLTQLQKNVAEKELEVATKRSQDQVSVDYARAAADVAKRDYWRKKEANDRVHGSVSQADIELANLQYIQYNLQTKKSIFELEIAAAEAEVKKKSLDAAKEHIARSEIKAPWAGAVDRVIRHTGDWVQPGDPVLRLVRMDKLRVKSTLKAAEYMPADVVGQPVSIVVKLPRGKTAAFQGKVTGVSPLVEAGGTFFVWAEVDNRKENGFWLLRDGMSADMTIDVK